MDYDKKTFFDFVFLVAYYSIANTIVYGFN